MIYASIKGDGSRGTDLHSDVLVVSDIDPAHCGGDFKVFYIFFSDIKRRMIMDPVSMIVEALVAGASLALKDTAGKAVKEAYDGLKALLVKQWKPADGANAQAKETEAKEVLDNLENNPEKEKDPEKLKLMLKEKLAKAMPEPNKALIEQAQQLHELLDEKGYGEGKYKITFRGEAKGVQTGDHNTQHNEFK